jgi:hypothetical protein
MEDLFDGDLRKLVTKLDRLFCDDVTLSNIPELLGTNILPIFFRNFVKSLKAELGMAFRFFVST